MKIIAYDHILPGASLDKIQPLLREEVAHAWELWKAGIIRENYSRTDRPGAVIVFECASVEEARGYVNQFPLVKAGLTEFDFIPVGAFTPLETLFAK
jgi:hypothetical protein